MMTTEDQAKVLREALELARKRPPTKDSMLRLRALAQMQGAMVEGAVACAFEGRGSTATEAKGYVRQLHEDYGHALRQAVAEEFAAEEYAKAKRWWGMQAKWRAFRKRMGV